MPLAAPPGPLWSADAKEPHPSTTCVQRSPPSRPTTPPTTPISAPTSAAWTTACEPSRSPSARSTSASRPWSGSTGRRRQPASRRVVFVPLEVGGAAADADQIDGHASNVSQRMLFGMTGRRRRPAGLTCCRPPARRARNQTWRTSRRVAVAASQRAFSLSMRSSPPRWRAGSRVAPSCPRWSGEKPLSRLPDFLPTSPPTMPISATTSAAWTTACEPSRSPSARSTSASRRFRGDAAGWSRRAGERSVGAAAELRRAMRVGSPFLPRGERRWSPACPRRRGLEAGGRFVHDVDVAGAGQFGGELAGEVRRRHRRTAD